MHNMKNARGKYAQRERERERLSSAKKREMQLEKGVAGHVEKGFWAVAPFFISHPRSPRLPCPPPAHLVRV